ncbi:MAG: hypothetical protein R3290_08115 [Acidimicrobiia bacterium]|nr:hypothetical protein [Acidimicrobiia bacterium]
MHAFAPRSALAGPARITFVAALLLFVATIVVGILNGIDVWEPDHDSLIGHVHAGTLGWITMGVSGIGFLMFSRDREVGTSEVATAYRLAWSVVGAITLYVGAFFLGDAVFDDRIQRPIVGTLLFVVVIWYLVWLLGAHRAHAQASAGRLGFVLAWISLIVGAAFGVILGLYIANGEVPLLSDDTAAAVAEAHPPAMVIGFLLLAAFAVIEWMLHERWSRAGAAQMWLLFVAGLVINIAFVTGLDQELAGPANLLMIVAGVMLLWRSREQLAPSGWRGVGAGVFPRMALVFLVVYLVLLTILVSWIVTETIDFDAVTDAQMGLILSFDHVMFIGVMTNVLFGTLAVNLPPDRTVTANRILIWGVNVGIAGFAVGLIAVEAVIKRIFTPILGVALLVGIWVYFQELVRARALDAVEESVPG